MIGHGLAGCLNFVAIFGLVLECFIVKERQLFDIGKCWQKDTTKSKFFRMYTGCWGKCKCCRNNCINATRGNFEGDNV